LMSMEKGSSTGSTAVLAAPTPAKLVAPRTSTLCDTAFRYKQLL